MSVTHSILPATSVDDYDDAAPQTLPVTVMDNDVELTVSPQAVTVRGGGNGDSYTVALNRAPTALVTATLTTSQTGEVTYGATNWNTAQAVAVSAGHDADEVDETVRVRPAAAAGSCDPGFSFAARTT